MNPCAHVQRSEDNLWALTLSFYLWVLLSSSGVVAGTCTCWGIVPALASFTHRAGHREGSVDQGSAFHGRELRMVFICPKACKTSEWTNNHTHKRNLFQKPYVTQKPKIITPRPFVEKVYWFPETMGKKPISLWWEKFIVPGSQKSSKGNENMEGTRNIAQHD